ncbi:hypothetical protein MTR_3g452940 [Medicago truncatula]|uniref:Uncharacterized protein n=1 Tax=Medicago truncatula TaxID=3880 RepID=A0A072UXK8_MEDTR|nr:hypothetical protein MTR_3g452940 [Medicago truncatula]
MAGWIDVHAQFNGGEPQRLKVRCSLDYAVLLFSKSEFASFSGKIIVVVGSDLADTYGARELHSRLITDALMVEV